MARTLSNVRAAVRFHIDEPAALYWSDAEINSYIGRRQLDLQRKIDQIDSDFFLKVGPGTQITFIAGTYIYALPADCSRVTAVRMLTSGSQGTEFRAVNPNTAQFQYGLRTDITIAIPTEILYAVRGHGGSALDLWVSPVPQSALQCQVDYSTYATEVVNDADTFMMPDSYVDYVEYMATVDALSKGPVGDSTRWAQLAKEAWNDIMIDLDTPKQDQNPEVVTGYGEGY